MPLNAPTAQHDHWRWPADVPADGRVCPVRGCIATMSLPEAFYETLENSIDRRTPMELYDDVRTFLELLALHVLVAEFRANLGGMSAQEARVIHGRIKHIYASKHPGQRVTA